MLKTIIDETIISDLGLVPNFISWSMQEVSLFPLTEDDVFSLRLCLHEALANAIKHGNASNKERHVRVKIKSDKKKLVLEVTDEGDGFDPRAVPNPTPPRNILKLGGRGLFLIKNQMDRVQFLNRGRTIRMTKILKGVVENERKT